MADQILLPRALDENANPEPGAKAYFYEAGTSTPLTVYSDIALTTPHASPLVSDSEGNFAQAFYNGAVGAKVDMYDASSVQMTGYPIDNFPTVSTAGSAAEDITFTPTVENPATDVQAAIENALTELADDTTPQLGGMLDVNGNAIGNGTEELLEFGETASAVNQFKITNSATGNGPELSATGDDANIDALITPKGTGRAKITRPNLIMGSDADGDIYFRSGGNLVRLAVGSGRQLLGVNAAGTGITYSRARLHIRDEKASGTGGGAFTAGSWLTRTLNTTLVNEITGASLATNQITLSAGSYEVYARAPADQTLLHKIKLRNVTDSTDILIGSNAYCSSGYNGHTDSVIYGRFTLADTKALELQHRCSNSGTFGLAAGFGVVEVYAEIIILQL